MRIPRKRNLISGRWGLIWSWASRVSPDGDFIQRDRKARRVGAWELAAQDIERGLIRRQRGDTEGARADLLKLLEVTVEGSLAEAARRQLQALDVKTR